MVELRAGDERYRDDSGAADPAVATALAAYADGMGGEHAVLIALAGSRLLVPVVAVLAADTDGGDTDDGDTDDGDTAGEELTGHGRPYLAPLARGEKGAEMAMPEIV